MLEPIIYKFIKNEFGMDNQPDQQFTEIERKGYLNKLAFFFEEKKTMSLCPYCNEPIDPEHAAVDHIIPFKTYARYQFLTDSKKSVYTVLDEDVFNDENFCLCCNGCNTSKGNRLDKDIIRNAITNCEARGVDTTNFINSLKIAEDIIHKLPIYISLYCTVGCYWEIVSGAVSPEAVVAKLIDNPTYTSFRERTEDVDITEVVQWLSQIRCIPGTDEIQGRGMQTGLTKFEHLWTYRTPPQPKIKGIPVYVFNNPENKESGKYIEPVIFYENSLLNVLNNFHKILELTQKKQEIFYSDSTPERVGKDDLSSVEAHLRDRIFPDSFSVEDDRLKEAYEYPHESKSTREKISKSLTKATAEKNRANVKQNRLMGGKDLRKYLATRQGFTEDGVLLYHCCYYCLGFYPAQSFQIDHIDPTIKKKKFHESINLLAVCQGCNNSKRANKLNLDFLDDRVERRLKRTNVSGLEDLIITSSLCKNSKIDIVKGIQAYVLKKHIVVQEGTGPFAVNKRIKHFLSSLDFLFNEGELKSTLKAIGLEMNGV